MRPQRSLKAAAVPAESGRPFRSPLESAFDPKLTLAVRARIPLANEPLDQLATFGCLDARICGFFDRRSLHIGLFSYDLRFFGESVSSDLEPLSRVTPRLRRLIIQNLGLLF